MATPESQSKFNREIYEQASGWLIELRTGDADAAVRQRLDAWFRASPEHIRAFLELSSVWEDGGDPELDRHNSTDALIAAARATGNVISLNAGPQGVLGPADESPSGAGPDSAEPIAPTRAQKVSRRSLLAAGIAVACLAAGGSLWFYSHFDPSYATGTGEQRSVKLADGSSVELNSRSRVRIRFSPAERDVDLLAGQALFRVAKDHARPFVVHSDSVQVRAVGTQFDVYRRKSATTVTVVEGRVAVLSPLLANSGRGAGQRASEALPGSVGAHGPLPESPIDTSEQLLPGPEPSSANADAAHAIILSAGEQVTVTPSTASRPTRTDAAAATAWTQRQLVFDSTPLTEVAQEFNRYNVRQLIISDPTLRDFHVTGVFSSINPTSLLRFLRTQPDISVTETDEDIRISKKGSS